MADGRVENLGVLVGYKPAGAKVENLGVLVGYKPAGARVENLSVLVGYKPAGAKVENLGVLVGYVPCIPPPGSVGGIHNINLQGGRIRYKRKTDFTDNSNC